PVGRREEARAARARAWRRRVMPRPGSGRGLARDAHARAVRVWPRRGGAARCLAPMTDAPRILTERRGDVVLLTLNAPERRNAIDQQMVDGLHRALDGLWHEGAVAALLITRAGDKAFAAGADI